MPFVRAATSADVDTLMALWEVAAENDSRPSDTAEAVALLVARDPEACLIAEDDGRIVGSIIAGWDGWRAHIYRLAVHPDVRRRGIGSLLLAAAEDRLTALGATRLDSTRRDGPRGQRPWTDHLAGGRICPARAVAAVDPTRPAARRRAPVAEAVLVSAATVGGTRS